MFKILIAVVVMGLLFGGGYGIYHVTTSFYESASSTYEEGKEKPQEKIEKKEEKPKKAVVSVKEVQTWVDVPGVRSEEGIYSVGAIVGKEKVRQTTKTTALVEPVEIPGMVVNSVGRPTREYVDVCGRVGDVHSMEAWMVRGGGRVSVGRPYGPGIVESMSWSAVLVRRPDGGEHWLLGGGNVPEIAKIDPAAQVIQGTIQSTPLPEMFKPSE